MTVEEQARSASSELRTSVARSLSPESSRRQLGTRLRRRRFEQGVLTVLCIAAVTGAAAMAVRPASHQSLPGGIPTVVPTASPASDCLFSVTCGDGIYRAALSIPTTFSLAGVLDVGSDTPSLLDLDVPSHAYGVSVVVHPQAVPSGGASPVGTDPRSLADSLAARADLDVLSQTSGVVAGRSATVVDLTPTAKASFTRDCPDGLASCLPLFSIDAVPGSPNQVWIGRDQTVRVMLIDVTGEGTLAVLVRDSTTDGYAPADAFIKVAPVLDSLAFGVS